MTNQTTIPTRPPGRRGWLLAAVAAGGLLVGCCGGFGLATIGSPAPEAAAPSPSPSPSPYVVTQQVSPPATSAAIETSSPAPTKAPVPTIEEGTWTVGDDFPAGTYRVTAPVDGDCYWAIYKSGTNGSDIIDNDIVTGGKPTVTLKRGQDFTTRRCGTWIKIK